MSNPDSFIDEVTEEMRREKLFGYLRRYGWIAVVIVLGIVGGTAWNEYRQAQDRAAAEAAGDALLAALAENDESARAAAMAGVDATGNAAVITALLTASTQEEAGDIDAAAATLGAVATDSTAPAIYRDLAAIKSAMLPVGAPEARLAALEALAQPGQPFRLLALEQMAYLTLESGDQPGAVAILRRIAEDAAVTRGLSERVQTLLIALGEDATDAEQTQ
ncbi:MULTISPECIES: tetratricopeptide repeat protein [unclassified Yoonia]|uniref:tetratricopeptide repeat protein n=1 Tax=unclassified Yoonia TaxID=2629118 RepID=UPI002AFDD82B|nr:MULTISPECIES: tetratricopeptide repeat protein [unclassified Yoonia]